MRFVIAAIVLATTATAPQITQKRQIDNGNYNGERPGNSNGNYNSEQMGNDNSNYGSISFLALGDSYTIGEKVDSTSRWPVQLARSLRAAGADIADPLIVAKTGWTTDELTAGIEKARVKGTYGLVSLLIGVNNQYRGRSAEEYRAQFHALLNEAIGFAGGAAAHVIVLSIPDWGVMPFAEGRDRAKIGQEIDQFNAIAREESRRAGAAWVDITPASRAMKEGWAAPDGLHPSGAQYAAWAALALESAKKALAAK